MRLTKAFPHMVETFPHVGETFLSVGEILISFDIEARALPSEY